MQNDQTEQLTKEINFNLLCRHNAVLVGDKVKIEIFRGSEMRRNKHKVAEIFFNKAEILSALEAEELMGLVLKEENKLNIPLVADKTVW